MYASSLREGWSAPRKAIYALASPLIPLVRFGRSLRLIRRPSHKDIVPTAVIPALALGILCDGAGQVLGHVAGVGKSEEKLSGYEYRRVDNVTGRRPANHRGSHGEPERPAMPDDADAPIASIVIPTHDRPSQLERCLTSVAAARAPGPIEVVVVDDGGSVPLDRIVEPFREAIGAVLIRKPHGGPGAARNLGVARARGRYIVFTDDDCAFDEGAIVAFVDGLAAVPGAMVGGRTINALPGNPFAAASQAIVDAVYAYNNSDPADARFFASNNMAVERSAILACGGFDERFTGAAEDRELCDRWRHRGGRLVYRPEAVVYHAHDLAARELRAPASRLRPRRVHVSPRSGGPWIGADAGRSPLPRRAAGIGSSRPRAASPAGTAARGAALALVWQAVNAAGWAEAAATDATQRALAAAAAPRRRRLGRSARRRRRSKPLRLTGFEHSRTVAA